MLRRARGRASEDRSFQAAGRGVCHRQLHNLSLAASVASGGRRRRREAQFLRIGEDLDQATGADLALRRLLLPELVHAVRMLGRFRPPEE